jgi:hypothetical protein
MNIRHTCRTYKTDWNDLILVNAQVSGDCFHSFDSLDLSGCAPKEKFDFPSTEKRIPSVFKEDYFLR